MARKTLRNTTTVHKWSEEDLMGSARLIVKNAIEGKMDRTESQLTMSLILNEAHRRQEMDR